MRGVIWLERIAGYFPNRRRIECSQSVLLTTAIRAERHVSA